MRNARRWQQLESLARSVRELAPAQRVGFLEESCSGDAELRREVEELVETYERASQTDGSVFLKGDFVPPSVVELHLGEHLDGYRILDQIGRGSMSTVYLAEPTVSPPLDPSKGTVAIKIALSGFDRGALERRFAAEREVLARLEHPNIARLYGGGRLTDGRPYVVMEYVDGTAIDVYCDERKRAIRDRLALFRRVCQAVHCVHQNLVVHRDIKPSSILVSGDGEPKLLDFSIALQLREGAAGAPEPGERPMTPPYASPEQIRGQEITPQSDVYSLGVVLYRLLTGRLPYGDASQGPREMERLLQGDAPPRPSRALGEGSLPGFEPGEIRGELQGGLDAIVLKSLALTPGRRYATAKELSDDLRRHLARAPG